MGQEGGSGRSAAQSSRRRRKGACRTGRAGARRPGRNKGASKLQGHLEHLQPASQTDKLARQGRRGKSWPQGWAAGGLLHLSMVRLLSVGRAYLRLLIGSSDCPIPLLLAFRSSPAYSSLCACFCATPCLDQGAEYRPRVVVVSQSVQGLQGQRQPPGGHRIFHLSSLF